MHALDLLNTANASTLVLLSFRLTGLMLVAPVFASRTVPMLVRTSILVVLSWLLFPAAVSATSGPAALDFANGIAEVLIGFAIGLGAAVFVGAAEAMGDLLAVQTGLSGASALDPLTNHSVPVLGQFANLFAIALLLSVDAHVLMLEALTASLQLLPIGGSVDAPRGIASMLALGSLLFSYGVRFAAPVLAAVLLANAALAMLSRAAPSLNILSVAFPIQIGLGLAALVATVPVIASFFVGWSGVYEGVVNGLFLAFRAGS